MVCSGMRHGVILALTLVVGIAACESAASTETNGIDKETITFGGILPMTGLIADGGISAAHGGQAYINDLNARGGIHGRKVRWIIEDDGYQAPRTVAAARKLIESDRVFGLFAGLGTNTALAVLPYVTGRKVLWAFPFAAAKQFTEPTKPTVFGLLPDYETQVTYLVENLLARKAGKKIGFVYVNTLENKLGAEAGIAVLRKYGLQAAAVQSYEKGTSDFSAIILSLQRAKADCVVLITATSDIARLIRDGSSRGFRPQWAGTTSAADPVILKLLGDDAEGIIGVTPTKPVDSDDAEIQEFRASLKRSFPEDQPNAYQLYTYAAAKILFHAVDLAGSDPTPDTVRQTLESLHNYETGIAPPVSMSPTDHMGVRKLTLIQVRKGKVLPVAEQTVAH